MNNTRKEGMQEKEVDNHPRFYQQIDGLRFFCVMGVLFQHFVSPGISHIFLTGLIGVDLFFIISGFLITENLLLLRSEHTIGLALTKFYFRRTLRIFPLYYFYWALVMIFFYREVSQQFTMGIAYLFNFYMMHHEVSALTGHLWSLSVEEQYYLAWPLVMFLIPARNLKMAILMLIIGASIFVAISFPRGWVYLNIHTVSCSVSLLSGAGLAVARNQKSAQLEKILKLPSWPLLPIAIGGLIVVNLWRTKLVDESWIILLRYLTCIAGVYLVGRAAYRPFQGKVGNLLLHKFCLRIGKISYGIYIYHYLVLTVLSPWLMPMYARLFSGSFFDKGIAAYIRYNHTLFLFPVYTICTLCLADLSYRVFETPFLKLKRFSNRLS